MKLFYAAAYGPAQQDAVWDRFLLAEAEGDVPDIVHRSAEFQAPAAKGYRLQRVREMRTPPVSGICSYLLLDSTETVGDGWVRVVAEARGEVGGA